MVTMPSEAANDPDLVAQMIERGIDIARINCAKDDAEAWRAMARHVRQAAHSAGQVHLDQALAAGPKLRTGPIEEPLHLRPGDRLELTREQSPEPANKGLARIGCTLPEVFEHVRAGDPILFDDGKMAGVVKSADADVITVRIEEASGSKLKGGKGINLPQTDLPVSALTDQDDTDLDTVIDIADLVAQSFVRTPQDVEDLLAALDAREAKRIGVVLKIETRSGFDRLPELLLSAMRRSRAAVMIARGDLAVEVGYERMAELQVENAEAVRGGPRAGRLGHPGAGAVGQEGPALARRDQ